MKVILSLVSIMLFITSCHSGQQTSTTNNLPAGIHAGIVQEAIAAGPYTYIRMKVGDADVWIAVTAMQAEVGKTYYYKDGIEMTNFHSKELNRDFPKVFFINELSLDPNMTPAATQTQNEAPAMGGNQQPMQGNKPTLEKQNIKVAPAAGGITIADLFAKKDQYEGKTVKIKGKVVKFSPEIMNTNWIHIQDGTENNGDFDLTLTSASTVKVGDMITIEGKVILDKDYGAGYFYKVIVEDASIVK